MLGAILGGLAGTVVSSAFGAHQAKKQMGFQERMSSTSHQREVADLRAAGLNPILSATGGPGASSPGGAMAHAPDASQTIATAAQVKNLREQNKVLTQQQWNLSADTELKKRQTDWWFQHGQHEGEQRSLTRARIPGAEREAELDSSAYGRFMRGVNRALPAVGAVSTGVGLGITSSALRARELGSARRHEEVMSTKANPRGPGGRFVSPKKRRR